MRTHESKNNQLLWGGHVAAQLAAEFGTPLFVYDEKLIILAVEELSKGDWEIHYALKANPSPEILKTLLRYGIGIDAVSANEVEYAISLGFDTAKIVYTSSSISEKEAKRVVDQGVLPNLNSIEEIAILGRTKRNIDIGIRINPDIIAGHHQHTQTAGMISKFGIHLGDIPETLKTAERYNFKIKMAHFHIGSGILDAEIFIQGFKNVLQALKKIELPHLANINLGGGFGTPYRPGESRLDLEHLIAEINKLHHDFDNTIGKKTKLVIEPGRYLVNESGVLLTNLNTVSRNDHRIFYRTDSGFNHLIRPAMYGSYHHFINATRVEGETEKVVLTGNICEGGDVFNGEPREITKGIDNDIFAIFDVGAYGVSMGMSGYNLRGLPAEIFIKENGQVLQLAKAQTLKDIVMRYEYSSI